MDILPRTDTILQITDLGALVSALTTLDFLATFPVKDEAARLLSPDDLTTVAINQDDTARIIGDEPDVSILAEALIQSEGAAPSPNLTQRQQIAFGVNSDLWWFSRNPNELYRIRPRLAEELAPCQAEASQTYVFVLLIPGRGLSKIALTEANAAAVIERHDCIHRAAQATLAEGKKPR